MIFNKTKIIFISILFFLFILILSLIFYIFISLTGCSEQNIKIDDDFVCFYSKKDWNYIKNTYPDELCEILSKYKNTKSKLYNYYLTKYTMSDFVPIRKAIKAINPNYTESEVTDATYEVLSYRHVIFHDSGTHKLDKNVEIIKRYENIIRKNAIKYDIPAEIPLAVMTWENSGDTSKMSYASCSGLGQMSAGAVKIAHDYAGKISREFKDKANIVDNEEKRKELLARADLFNIATRHKKMAKELNISDERIIPECNAEDSVIYLKTLMNSFENVPDLAISAYHNGTTNNADLMKALMKSHSYSSNMKNFIKDKNINYLSLWKNQKVRNMMNGYLTMEGEITNSKNYYDALADESDIYPWKIFGAYSAFVDTPEGLADKIYKCRGTVIETETEGLEKFNSLNDVEKAVKEKILVKQKHKSGKNTVDIYMRPELAGFIAYMFNRLKTETNGKAGAIPATGFISEKYLLKEDKRDDNLMGIAFDCNLKKFKYASKLRNLLQHEYLNDRIYLSSRGNIVHICLNPRSGLEFYEYAEKYELIK